MKLALSECDTVMSVCLSVCVCVWSGQSVRSYENKLAGVFVSGFDPSSDVSRLRLYSTSKHIN